MDTIDDIIAEMERFGERHRMHGEGQAVREFAKRLKQSVTDCNQLETVDLESRCIYGEVKEPTCEKSSQVGNEPMTLDEAIAHAEEAVNDTPCGQEHKQLADWLKELREIKVGNAAKMRAVLDEIRVAAMSDYEPDADYLIEKCNAALSAPARNCELYETEDEAWKAYLKALEDMPEETHVYFETWLFAKAKGGDKNDA